MILSTSISHLTRLHYLPGTHLIGENPYFLSPLKELSHNRFQEHEERVEKAHKRTFVLDIPAIMAVYSTTNLDHVAHMHNTLTRIRVFIASPGDVPDERERVRQSVQRANDLSAKYHGILLEPIGWEDIPPGKAPRTQDLINPYVDRADIFIGILKRRFGQPTGRAESGTEEEYNRIEQRWHVATPKPAIAIYFKSLPQEDLSDPGEHLQRVLAFKKRIFNTLFYKEFDTSDDLANKVEAYLAHWIHEQGPSHTSTEDTRDVDPIQPTDITALAKLLQQPDATLESPPNLINLSPDDPDYPLVRLTTRGLLLESQARLRPSNSTEGFLVIAKHLIAGPQWRSLLQSQYYSRMLAANLRDVIAARFHCTLPTDTADLLRKLAITSPASASYLLFGDTTLYDNLAEQPPVPGTDANDTMTRNILFRALLNYANDLIDARIAGTLDGQPIAASVITLNVAAGYETTLAFRASVKAPIFRGRAATDLQKGQFVFGSPATLVHMGTIFMTMGEDEYALEAFDRTLASDNPPEVRSAALNNKGLILLKRGEREKAIGAFREASDISPELPQPRLNLAAAQSSSTPELPPDSDL